MKRFYWVSQASLCHWKQAFLYNFKRYFAMTGNDNRSAPLGVICLQKISSCLCPRVRFNRKLCYQWSVLILTYFTYMSYHLSRKPISVVKNVLHQNCSGLQPPPDVNPDDDNWCNWAPFNNDKDANTLLGMIDSAFLFSYAIAMFVSGFVAERVDLRYFLAFGMLSSGVFSYLFGLARTYGIHSLAYFILIQAAAGVAQTTGWPGAVAVVGNWYGKSKKGLIFGIWNSHTSFGNILGTLIAARYVETDWALSFMYPGLIISVMGFVIFLFLVPEPADVGLQLEETQSRQTTPIRRRSDLEDPSQVIVGDQTANLRPSRYSANTTPESHRSSHHEEEVTESSSLLGTKSSQSSAVSLAQALAIPGVIEFSLSLFFAKLVSYTFLYWLPLYIKSSTALGPEMSGELSTLFDVGGIVGAIVAGAVSDYTTTPAITCSVFYILSVPTLLLYQKFGNQSLMLNIILLMLNGVLVNGPYALITTAVSAELGTHSCLAGNSKALATVTAIIDGTGSVGAALGPLLAAVVSNSGSWSKVFYVLVCCNVAALLLLMRIVRTEMQKIRQRRILGSRPVRIE